MKWLGPDAMIFVFWMLCFKPAFSLSSFTFIKRLFSFSSLTDIRVVSSAYLRLLIFLLAILILAYSSSSLVFCMMYSVYKFNKQGNDIQSWHNPFPIWNQSSSSCCFLTCMQISQEAGMVVWYSHLFKKFPVCCDPHSQRLWHSQYTEIDVFLKFSWFFYDPVDVGSSKHPLSKTLLDSDPGFVLSFCCSCFGHLQKLLRHTLGWCGLF